MILGDPSGKSGQAVLKPSVLAPCPSLFQLLQVPLLGPHHHWPLLLGLASPGTGSLKGAQVVWRTLCLRERPRARAPCTNKTVMPSGKCLSPLGLSFPFSEEVEKGLFQLQIC